MNKQFSRRGFLKLAGGVAVVAAGTWSVYFDGTANGLGTSADLDVDAFSLP